MADNEPIEFEHACIIDLAKRLTRLNWQWSLGKPMAFPQVHFKEYITIKKSHIKVYIYPKEHNPPHFHVRLNGRDCGSYLIKSGVPHKIRHEEQKVKQIAKDIKEWHDAVGCKPILDFWHEINPNLRRE